MSTAAVETLSIIDLLAAARSGLVRLDPHAARAAWRAGGLLVEQGPHLQRMKAKSWSRLIVTASRRHRSAFDWCREPVIPS